MQTKKSFFLGILGIFVILACIGSNAGTPTPYPTLTNTPCVDVPYTPAAEDNIKPTFYFILVDGTLNYSFERVIDTTKVLELMFPFVLKGGDRITIGWINDKSQYYGIESSIFYNDVFSIEYFQIPLTPTLPPTYGPQNTPTPTPTSPGQLRQTEIAKTVGAVREQEQEFIRNTLNEYFCQKGAAVAEISEINQLIENLRTESINTFSNRVKDSFPKKQEYQASENNPLFEVITETSEFVLSECNLVNYSNCILVIFSDLEDFRQNFSSDKVPYTNMAGEIDVVPILYRCQFATACEKKIVSWQSHFTFFNARNTVFVLNSDANKEDYNEKISRNLSATINLIKNK